MNLELVEKFMSGLVPETERHKVRQAFQDFADDPSIALAASYNTLNQNAFLNENRNIAAAGFNGLVCGIMIAAGSDHPDIQAMLKLSIEHNSRNVGENVASLLEHKQKKGVR